MAHPIQSGPHVSVLAHPDGRYAMVALDQRESLRTMFSTAKDGRVEDATLRDFKRDAVEALSPYASAILLDRPYGIDGVTPALHESCALILAADQLDQPEGEPVRGTDLDPLVTASYAARCGAAALKLLVLWYPDRGRDERDDLIARFRSLCREAALPGIVEAVVRPPQGVEASADWGRDDAIVAAAREVSAHEPDMYKGEIPAFGRGDLDYITRRCAEVTDALDCPWVVLSSGVHADDFPTAVAAACRGGAAGFLAGRAIWADAVGTEDPSRWLRTSAVDRLRRLRETVAAATI